MTNIRVSTVNGSSLVLASASSCSFIPKSVSKRSRSLTVPTNGYARTRLTHSRRWSCMPSSVRSLPWYQYRLVLPIFPTTRRESKVPDKITYFAIIDGLSSRERPAGVLRRIYFEAGGQRDEAFSRDLVWKHTSLLISAERGDLKNEFIEITEGEANQIVDRIRATVTGTSNG